jgi:hypothetical protein
MVTAVMKQKLCNFIICILLSAGIFFLYTCAFTGDVYVGFFWSTGNDAPAAGTDFSAVPNAPANPANIINGGYFLTLPGSYSIDYVAAGGGSFLNQSITLTAASAVGGIETTYFNVFLSNTGGITVKEGP